MTLKHYTNCATSFVTVQPYFFELSIELANTFLLFYFIACHKQPMSGTESFQEGTQEMLLVEVKSNSSGQSSDLKEVRYGSD